MPSDAKRRYFNGIAPQWDQLPSPEDAPAKVQRFLEQAGMAGARWILDVGCGTGILLRAILERHPSAVGVAEADFAESMLKQNALKTKHPRVHRTCADVTDLPFRSECFELVLCFGIIPHLENQREALAEFLRVLRPGGAVCAGHLMSSHELNAFHGSLDAPVAGDVLPPAEALAATLSQLGAASTDAQEEPGWYFVRAEKAAR